MNTQRNKCSFHVHEIKRFNTVKTSTLSKTSYRLMQSLSKSKSILQECTNCMGSQTSVSSQNNAEKKK